MTAIAEVTAIVTAFRRIPMTLDTLRRLEGCRPAPAEILVHVDGNETTCAEAIREALPHLRIIVSESSVGPGGGRNKLVAAASHELVASFDDDSYPFDSDYFERVSGMADLFPDASIYSAAIFHRGEPAPLGDSSIRPVASFGSGGAVFRRSAYLRAGGFVALPVAYGMEEEDLALRLIDRGETILRCPVLRVFHDTDLHHHATPSITAGAIANIALLAALRYPVVFWPYGCAQVANRIWWGMRHGRRTGTVTGIMSIPGHIWRHRRLRAPVSIAAMAQRTALRQRMSNTGIE